MSVGKILVVDDESDIRRLLQEIGRSQSSACGK